MIGTEREVHREKGKLSQIIHDTSERIGSWKRESVTDEKVSLHRLYRIVLASRISDGMSTDIDRDIPHTVTISLIGIQGHRIDRIIAHDHRYNSIYT